MDKNMTKFDSSNSKEYKAGEIKNNTVYTRKSKAKKPPKLYYPIFQKVILKE